jgi:hypothetical protein
MPDFSIAYYALSARDQNLGREEEFLANVSKGVRLMASDPSINPHYANYAITAGKGNIARLTGDFTAAIPIFESGVDLPDDFSVLGRGNFTNGTLESMVRQHDLAAMRAFARYLVQPEIRSLETHAYLDAETEDWRHLDSEEAIARALIAQAGNSNPRNPRLGAQGFYDYMRPWFALAKAKLGDFKAAEAMIAPTAPDNDPALRMRGLIAELQGQYERADWWFARAEARAAYPLCRRNVGPGAAGTRTAGRGHRQIHIGQSKRSAFRRCAGRLGRGVDGKKGFRRAGEI